MERTSNQRLRAARTDTPTSCGRPGCACSLPIGERFVLWALRQWREDRAMPMAGATLRQAFGYAGLLEVLPDFAIAMEAFVCGARQALHIHEPTCSEVSRDEALLVALCGLAQSDHDGPMMVSLDKLMVPAASRVAGVRLKIFAMALADAGFRLSPAPGEAGARLH